MPQRVNSSRSSKGNRHQHLSRPYPTPHQEEAHLGEEHRGGGERWSWPGMNVCFGSVLLLHVASSSTQTVSQRGRSHWAAPFGSL